MRLIGLHGKAGAGKDTFADRLMERHGFVKTGFSDELYEEVAAAYGIEVTDLMDRKTKEIPWGRLAFAFCDNSEFRQLMVTLDFDLTAPRTPRQVLELWGTDYRRNRHGQNYWIDRMAEFVDAVDPEHKGVVIRDCRFINEAEWIRVRGGQIYEIVRPGLPDVSQHVSARRLPEYLIDVKVPNTSDLNWLRFCADFAGYLKDEYTTR